MKKYLFVLLGLSLALGCARLRVEAPKEAIKLDVAMRLDVYQHIEKDIDNIENMVSGPQNKPLTKEPHTLLEYFVSDAYADDGLGPEVEGAAARRKDRRSDLFALEAQGIIGENRSGMVEIRMADQANASAQGLVQAENSDRMTIYNAVAAKNGSSVDEVQHIYAKRLQSDAPAGAPLEEDSGWKIK